MNSTPIEPSAANRQMAHMLREMFLALVREDFTERQALTLIGQMMIAGQQGQQ